MLLTRVKPALVRWLKLLQYRLVDTAKPLGLGLSAAAVVDLAPLLFGGEPWISGGTMGRDGMGWTVIVLFGAVLTASSAFRSFHGRGATEAILWPASSLETYAAAVAESLVVVPLVLTVGAVALSLVASMLNEALHGHSLATWIPWDQNYWGLYKTFPFTVLMFLTGASVFRRFVVLKTLLIYFGVYALAGLAAFGIFALTNLPQSAPGEPWALAWNSEAPWHLNETGRVWVDGLLKFWAWGPTVLFCLTFGWAKIQEKEARNEVQ